MRVIKRDGTYQSLDMAKIQRAMLMAFSNTREQIPDVGPIVHRTMSRLPGGDMPVDDISKAIEEELCSSGFGSVAAAFIRHRVSRDAARARRLTPDSKALSDYIHVGKYAKHRPELGRRELHAETVSRVEEMHIRRFPQFEAEIRAAFAFVYSYKLMPSMRSMQFGGAAIEQNHARMYNCSFTHVNRWRVFQEIFFLLLSGCGVGYSVQWQHVDELSEVGSIDPKKVYHYEIPDTIEGWADALGVLIESYRSGVYVEFSFSKIRPEGSQLKTSGGKAPGHLPLKKMLEQVRAVLDAAQGRKLRPLECHDIICYAAEAVLAGGIRRSSLISLFSLNDTEMLYCKAKGNFRPAWGSDPGLNSHRQMANNSAALLRGSVSRAEFDRIVRVAQENYGCPGFYFTNNLDYGANPCVTADQWLATDRGLRQMGHLVGEKIRAVQANGEVLDCTPVQQTGTNQAILKMTLSNGQEIRATGNHKFPTMQGLKKLGNIFAGDKVLLQYAEGAWGNHGSYEEGLTIGLWHGDGTRDGNLAYIDLWNEDCDHADYIEDCCQVEVNRNDYGDKVRIGGAELGRFVPETKEQVDHRVMWGSREMVAGYLCGLIFTDGSVQGSSEKGVSIRIAQSNKLMLQQVQILMSNFGLLSSLRQCRAAGPRETPTGVSDCKAQYELIVSGASAAKLIEITRLFGPKAEKWERIRPRKHYKQNYWVEVRSIETDSVENVYCLNVPKTNRIVVNGIKTSNCGEIGLYPVIGWSERSQKFFNYADDFGPEGDALIKKTGFSFCNLVECNGALIAVPEDLRAVAQAGAFIGTLQASYTDFPYLGPVTEAIVRREALLGVGLTGIQDSEVCRDPEALETAALSAVATNRVWAPKLGIEVAARVTTVKPSGTASKALGGVGEGIHPRYARRYFQRVTANPNEPVARYFRSINPHMVDVKPNGDWSICFPIQCADGARTVKEMPALEFVDDVLTVYQHWIKPGTSRPSSAPGLTHNVSCTVTLRDGEMQPVLDTIWERRADLCAMSFVPLVLDKSFPFIPKREVYPEDEERWNNLIEMYRPVDWSQFSEAEDTTTRRMTVACGPEGCA